MERPKTARATAARIGAVLLMTFVAGQSNELAAQGATYPARGKTITLLVPWDAGGGVDVTMRLLEPHLKAELGATIQIENRPGGGSQAGLTRCAAARPDGYTLCATSLPSTNFTYADAERKAPYNRASFIPIGTIANDVGSVVVKADSKYKTLEDLISDARANPGKVRVGSAGRFTNAHLDMLTAERATKTSFASVFFTGGATATTALLGGHVDAIFSTPSNYMAQVRSGDVRVLAIMSENEIPQLKGVPTFKSQGYDAYGFSTRTLSVQKGTPEDVVLRLQAALQKASASSEFRERIQQVGLEAVYMDGKKTEELWKKVDVDVPAALATAPAK